MPKKSNSVHACWIFSVTYYGDETEQPKVHKVLKVLCKKFVYQLERGKKKGKLHYQIYMNLREKRRAKQLGAVLSARGLKGATASPASDEGKESLKGYCMKEDTRVAGPWADHFIYRGQDLITELRPWQQEILDLVKQPPHRRKIYWYYDTEGGAGKSSFSKYMWYHHDVLPLSFGDSKDLLNLVYKHPGRPCYFFDLSRTKGKKTSMNDVYCALESIKNGLVVNTKYETGVAGFMIPHVIIFANHMPQVAKLSVDRWVIINLQDCAKSA